MSDRLQLDANWPGLDARGGQIDVDPDAMIALAEKLEGEAEKLSAGGAGTPAGLAERTNLPCASFGSWQTAYEMETGHHEARHYVVHYFGELVELLRETARQARQAAGAYQETDEALQGAFNGQQAALDDRPVEVG